MLLRFARPLAAPSSAYPSYRTDRPLTASIVRWCSGITLGGRQHDLSVRPADVFQFPSVVVNAHSYFATVSAETTRQVLAASEKAPKLEARLGVSLKTLDVIAGVIHLYRGIGYRPATKARDDRPARPRHLAVADLYWFDIVCRVKEDRFAPLIRIYRDVATPFYIPTDPSRIIRVRNQLSAGEYYPGPTDVVLDWHDHAREFGLDHTRLYLAACFYGAAIARWVYSPDGLIYRGLDYAPAGAWWPGVPQWFPEQPPPGQLPNPWQPAGYGYYVAQIQDPAFRFPATEFTRRFDPRIPGHAFQRMADGAVQQVDDKVPVAFGNPNIFCNIEPPIQTPRPPFPEGSIEALAVIRLFLQASGDRARYLGKGRFLVSSRALTVLAAGSGNFGSAESEDIGVQQTSEDSDDGGAAGKASVGIDPAQAIDMWKWYHNEQFQEEIEACVGKGDVDACLQCIRNSGMYDSTEFARAVDVAEIAIGGLLAVVGVLIGNPWVLAAGAHGVAAGTSGCLKDNAEMDNLERRCSDLGYRL
jgi:hypothetical protein